MIAASRRPGETTQKVVPVANISRSRPHAYTSLNANTATLGQCSSQGHTSEYSRTLCAGSATGASQRNTSMEKVRVSLTCDDHSPIALKMPTGLYRTSAMASESSPAYIPDPEASEQIIKDFAPWSAATGMP